MKVKVSSIVLAAGLSSRMSLGNKLLLKIDETTIIEKTIMSLSNSNIHKLYVVLGHQNDKLSKVLNALNLTMVYNYSYRKGISSSIITGITMLDDTTDGVMICLADMPKISSLTYNIIIKIFNRFYKPNAPLIILPKFNNKDGNPVIFSSYFFSKLKKLNGDRGAKTLINKYKKYVKEVTLDDNSIIKDIDDITAYKELINDAK